MIYLPNGAFGMVKGKIIRNPLKMESVFYAYLHNHWKMIFYSLNMRECDIGRYYLVWNVKFILRKRNILGEA